MPKVRQGSMYLQVSASEMDGRDRRNPVADNWSSWNPWVQIQWEILSLKVRNWGKYPRLASLAFKCTCVGKCVPYFKGHVTCFWTNPLDVRMYTVPRFPFAPPFDTVILFSSGYGIYQFNYSFAGNLSQALCLIPPHLGCLWFTWQSIFSWIWTMVSLPEAPRLL